MLSSRSTFPVNKHTVRSTESQLVCNNKSACAMCYHLDFVCASQDEDIFRVTMRQNSEVCGLPLIFHLHGSLKGQRLNSEVIYKTCSSIKKSHLNASLIKPETWKSSFILKLVCLICTMADFPFSFDRARKYGGRFISEEIISVFPKMSDYPLKIKHKLIYLWKDIYDAKYQFTLCNSPSG